MAKEGAGCSEAAYLETPVLGEELPLGLTWDPWLQQGLPLLPTPLWVAVSLPHFRTLHRALL